MRDRVVFITGAKGGLESYIPRRAGSTRTLSDQSGHELDEISPVMQLFVIDWSPACGVGSSFNPKDRASRFHFQRRRDIGFSWHCVQLVLGLNQWNVVFAFKERKDGLDFQVVGDDFLADLQREVGLIEGEGNTIRQAHATNSDDALALCQSELTRHGCIGRENLLSNHPGRRLRAKSVHILHKSAQLCQLLRDLRCSNECAFAATNLDKTAAHKILNSPPNGNTADTKSRNEAIFGRQLVANLQVAMGDLAGEDRFDT